MATLGLLLMAPPAFAAEEETAGNSLAMPVIWAEDTIGPTLRGDDDEESDPQESALPDAQLGTYSVDPVTGVITYNPADTTYINEADQDVFLQQVENNWWQAEHRKLSESGLDLTSEGRLAVTWVDWGDNLEVKDWSTKQKIRVETRLLQDVTDLPDADVAGDGLEGTGMTGYQMAKLKDALKGPEEMWGVVAEKDGNSWFATENQVTEAFVYTGKACLTIERVDLAGTMKWDSDAMTWTGTPVPGFPVCMGEGEGGLNELGAEVTISGGMTYGSVWDPSDLPDGLYRMTFSLQKGSGVDIADESVLYVSEEEEPAEVASTTAVVSDASGSGGPGTGGSGGSGSEPEGNQAVIVPELDLTYIDVGMGFEHGSPTRPVNLKASPGIASMTLTWDPPVYEGTSDITGYMVTAGVYGQYFVEAGTTTKTIDKLPGGAKTLFTVVALNDEGPGDPAAVVATPLSPTTPPTTPPTVTPPTDQGQAVTVQVRAVSGGKKLYVNVGPNKGKGYYQFTVQKLSGGTWRTLPKVYKTYGNGETRRLRLSKGTYRVIVLPRYGLQGMTSEVIGLRTAVPSALPVETDQAVSLIAQSKSDERKLYVNLDPNMGTGYFQFVVQKQSGGQWKALSKVYKTKTRAEKRTLNLRRGTYRVIVMPRYGYQGSMSDPIWLRR